MHAATVGLIGIAGVAACVRAARKGAVRDRLRFRRRTVRVPAPVAARIALMLEEAAINVSVEQASATWGWAVIVVTMLGLGLGGTQAALAASAGTALGVPAIVVSLRGRGARRIAAAVPDTLDEIAAELRAGGTIPTAVAAIANGDGPLAADFARLDARTRLGATVSEGLRAWTTERSAPGVGASAGALALCATVGGPASDALEGLASSLRGQLAVAAEARALSAQARMSALVVGGAPLLYLAWSGVVDPHALHALTGSSVGHACFVAGIALEVAGAWWMRRILRSGAGGVITALTVCWVAIASLVPVSFARRLMDAERARALRPRPPRARSFLRVRGRVERFVEIPAARAIVTVVRAPARARRRRRHADELLREIAVAVDLVGVGVAAGCTPFLAVDLASAWSPRLVAADLAGIRRACELGQSFDESLRLLGRRTPELRGLTDCLRTSARLGSAVGPGLTRLAGEVRADLRRRAEAWARTVPVRLCFPLVGCILPAFASLTVVPVVLAGLHR